MFDKNIKIAIGPKLQKNYLNLDGKNSSLRSKKTSLNNVKNIMPNKDTNVHNWHYETYNIMVMKIDNVNYNVQKSTMRSTDVALR